MYVYTIYVGHRNPRVTKSPYNFRAVLISLLMEFSRSCIITSGSITFKEICFFLLLLLLFLTHTNKWLK